MPPVYAAGLRDPWAPSAGVPLDRVLERQQYPPFLTAFLMLVLAFFLFQFVVSPVVLVLLLLLEGLPPAEMLTALSTVMEERAGVLLAANTAGQIFGLAIPAVLIARMHSSRWAQFLRLRGSDGVAMGLAVLGLAAITPFVQWLGTVNESLPLPEALREFEEAQMDLLETVLLQGGNVWANLLMLAVTPAICEELLFRGYVQRQSERGLGVVGGILFSGLAFGLYHLRLTQFAPLAALGLYLAYLTWRTGSLWPAIIVHFANNAFAVALSAYVATNPELDVQELEQMQVPWYYIVGGLLAFVLVMVILARREREQLAQRTAPQAVYHDPVTNEADYNERPNL